LEVSKTNGLARACLRCPALPIVTGERLWSNGDGVGGGFAGRCIGFVIHGSPRHDDCFDAVENRNLGCDRGRASLGDVKANIEIVPFALGSFGGFRFHHVVNAACKKHEQGRNDKQKVSHRTKLRNFQTW